MSVSSHRRLVRHVDHLLEERQSRPEPPDPQTVADLWTVAGLPRSASYDPGWFMSTGIGPPNVLWLTELLTQVMELHAGMRVLDLGCGTAQSSIFLAREFDAQVWAADLWVDPTDNWQRIQDAGEARRVTPVSVEAHDLPFADGFFDAIVSLDAYHYFGTDERYLPSLLPLLRPGGQIGIVVPGNSADPEDPPPDLPDLGWPASDFFTFRSADWWRRMWSRSGEVEVTVAGMVPNGHALWERSLDLDAAWSGLGAGSGSGSGSESGSDSGGDLASGDRLMLASAAGQTLGFSRVVARRLPVGAPVLLSDSHQAHRVGQTVVRPSRPWTAAVHALLRHLEEVGFDAAPRLVDGGLDAEGNEVLAFIDGTSPQPHAWTDLAVARVGALLRSFHDATATFRPPANAVWQSWPHRSTAPGAVIGHCDLGPWNILARDGMPVAFIDWESAGPIDRLDEVALAAMLNAQLHGDDVAVRVGLPPAEARAHQLRLFTDAYGLNRNEREGLIERMLQVAILECERDTDQAGITPDHVGPHPMVWSMAWRARGAAWMLRHRPMLQAALLD